MSRGGLGRTAPCFCGSGNKYKRCCYPRTLPDFSKPKAGIPSPLEQREATHRALSRHEEQLSRNENVTIDSVDVGRTRLMCAPMAPYGGSLGLPGTMAPPTPLQVEAKYEEIRAGNPDGVTEIVVSYTYPEMFGFAEACMVFDADDRFELADGRPISVLDLFRGMNLRMADGSTGTILGNPQRRYDIPVPPLPEANGLWSSRVVAQVKHTADEIVEFCWGGQMVRVTPGHAVWSESRCGWVGAHELFRGEMIRVSGNVAAPVEAVRRVPGLVEVFGIEVEYFHNYFVGRGPNSMLVHNGPECVGKPKQAGFFDDIPDPEGPLSGGVRSLRRNQYDPAKIEPGRVVRGTEEIRAIVGDALRAEGNYTDNLSGLFSFLKQGGGAGFQGVTRNPLDRTKTVIRNFGESSGEVMAAVDLTRIDPARVFDFRNAAVREAFLARYPKFSRMFDRMAAEGVVAVRGDIPVDALTGVVRIPKSSDAATVRGFLQVLMGGE